jgi:hypothetical protein
MNGLVVGGTRVEPVLCASDHHGPHIVDRLEAFGLRGELLQALGKCSCCKLEIVPGDLASSNKNVSLLCKRDFLHYPHSREPRTFVQDDGGCFDGGLDECFSIHARSCYIPRCSP